MCMVFVLVGTAALLGIDWEAMMLDMGEPLQQLPAAPPNDAPANGLLTAVPVGPPGSPAQIAAQLPPPEPSDSQQNQLQPPAVD